MTSILPRWTRRAWLAHHAVSTATLAVLSPRRKSWCQHGLAAGPSPRVRDATTAARVAAQAEQLDPAPLQAFAQQAVEAARAAGAQYADARLTRSVGHGYSFGGDQQSFAGDAEVVGLGVRALVNGYWGFAACPFWIPEMKTPDTVVRLAREAVGQATMNARGTPRTVELGQIPAATGSWATPVRIDPFHISVEEKLDVVSAWLRHAERYGLYIQLSSGSLTFVRQERILATSDGVLVTQTLYQSGGGIVVVPSLANRNRFNLGNIQLPVRGLTPTGAGWELILDAKVPEQLEAMLDLMKAQVAIGAKPFTVGRRTLVCDGTTMASLLDQTLGIATQLDRALGYEANAGGTSFLTDPLGMVGTFTLAAPGVTVTANRTAPAQLATVQWDDEGVEPQPFTLVRDGVLVDFQTAREQAAWLAPYYAKQGRPVRSHGCAAAEDALVTTLPMMPNLALEPGSAAIHLEDLVSDVKDGLLVTDGAAESDFQARNGLLTGPMREIKNGRVGQFVLGGAVQFNTLDVWKHLTAIGGPMTMAVIASGLTDGFNAFMFGAHGLAKGQPSQATTYSVRSVAATLANQPLIDVTRKV